MGVPEMTKADTAPNVCTPEETHPGMLARVRPYYHVPSGRSSLSSVRSPFTYEVSVIERVGGMWTVEFTWGTDSAPWPRRQAFFARELHKAYKSCPCAACTGDGIHERHGA